ncbi:PREDICTED: uncharacterized protein LOC109486326 [Branchiostoma belcheri]|uniref:Uncharacterized protein LOC109486326 n=1 Tax=Branchiostoma belcheri TaxID=7741 RepID=A0A6P5A7Y2_BRABE|nr:PREDICTED: uncharacterized protein LOC109486326 [Branchiostoma belcheri]
MAGMVRIVLSIISLLVTSAFCGHVAVGDDFTAEEIVQVCGHHDRSRPVEEIVCDPKKVLGSKDLEAVSSTIKDIKFYLRRQDVDCRHLRDFKAILVLLPWLPGYNRASERACNQTTSTAEDQRVVAERIAEGVGVRRFKNKSACGFVSVFSLREPVFSLWVKNDKDRNQTRGVARRMNDTFTRLMSEARRKAIITAVKELTLPCDLRPPFFARTLRKPKSDLQFQYAPPCDQNTTLQYIEILGFELTIDEIVYLSFAAVGTVTIIIMICCICKLCSETSKFNNVRQFYHGSHNETQDEILSM